MLEKRRFKSKSLRFLRHVAGCAVSASNSGVATLRNFCRHKARKNACWGAPQTRWTSGQIRAVDKPPYIGNISDYHGKLCIKLPISVAKKKVMVCYAMAFIIRFRFNAVDDKRHCCSAASNPLLYRNFKLCLAFCVAKLPSLHICRRSKTFACLSVPSFS